eukprot:scaffold11048_cov152-Skeletonema_dohrnii-CCMP3373.AAC.6
MAKMQGSRDGKGPQSTVESRAEEEPGEIERPKYCSCSLVVQCYFTFTCHALNPATNTEE